MKKLLFVFNPHSGKGEIKYHLLDIINVFVRNGYEVTTYPTQSRRDGYRYIVENGNGYDMVACSGGDGTLNEVISAVMKLENRPVIGYIPSGTTNDFAKSLKLPAKMSRAAKVLMDGEIVKIDIGSFNDNNFVYVAAFGDFTDIVYQTSQEIKSILGHAAYLIEGLRSIPRIKARHVIIKTDTETIEDDFVFGMVTNSVSVGGFKGIAGKGVDLTDGIFEVGLVKPPKNPIQVQNILNAAVGMEFSKENIIRLKSSRVWIKSDEDLTWVLDGEEGGIHKEVLIENNKQAISIVSNVGLKK